MPSGFTHSVELSYPRLSENSPWGEIKPLGYPMIIPKLTPLGPKTESMWGPSVQTPWDSLAPWRAPCAFCMLSGKTWDQGGTELGDGEKGRLNLSPSYPHAFREEHGLSQSQGQQWRSSPRSTVKGASGPSLQQSEIPCFGWAVTLPAVLEYVSLSSLDTTLFVNKSLILKLVRA